MALWTQLAGIALLSELGRSLTSVTGDSRETMYRPIFSSGSPWRSSGTIRWLSRVLFWSLPNWTSATPANLDLNPRDLYHRGNLKKIFIQHAHYNHSTNLIAALRCRQKLSALAVLQSGAHFHVTVHLPSISALLCMHAVWSTKIRIVWYSPQ